VVHLCEIAEHITLLFLFPHPSRGWWGFFYNTSLYSNLPMEKRPLFALWRGGGMIWNCPLRAVGLCLYRSQK